MLYRIEYATCELDPNGYIFRVGDGFRGMTDTRRHYFYCSRISKYTPSRFKAGKMYHYVRFGWKLFE